MPTGKKGITGRVNHHKEEITDPRNNPGIINHHNHQETDRNRQERNNFS